MYAPRGGTGPEVGDVEVFPHGDEIHLFHLTLPNHDVVQHAVSDDGLAWRSLPAALRTSDPGACDDDMIWTMSVTERGGCYYMLYTALGQAEDGQVQRTALATSDDLIRWTKHPDNPVAEADPRWYEADRSVSGRVSWRDPKPILVGDTYYATLNGRENDGPLQRRGCAALIVSKDLIHWEARRPLFAPRRYWDLECPQVFVVDGHYYLTSAIMEDRLQHYWMAPAIEGPYQIPPDGGVLTPVGHYAGRVARWRGLDLFYCWHKADYDWAGIRNTYGKFVPAPLVLRRRRDGSLRCESFPGWRNYRTADPSPPVLAISTTMQHNAVDRASWRVDAATGMDLSTTAETLGDFHLSGRFVLNASRGGIGLRLDAEGGGYFVEMNAGSADISLQKWLMPQTGDRPNYGYREIQRGKLHRPLPFGARVPIRVLSVDGYIEVEVGGDVVIATFSRERVGGYVGLWAEGGQVSLLAPTIAPMRAPRHE